MIFPIPGGKKIGSHYLPRYTRYRVIAGCVIKGGHCINVNGLQSKLDFGILDSYLLGYDIIKMAASSFSESEKTGPVKQLK